MDVEVITTEANQRVKLDATLTIQVETGQSASSFLYDIQLRLVRGADLLSITCQKGSYDKPINSDIEYHWHPSLTFVDMPGPAGTYVYTVVAFVFNRVNVPNIVAQNLGLTAIVFPPA